MSEGMATKEVSKEYWNLGLNVIPVKGKKPLVSWKEWQTKQQERKGWMVYFE
jgi:hypothetical protein